MVIKQVLTRVYVNDIESSIKFYEQLFNEKCSSRINYQKAGLELAGVGNILILCGSEKALEPFRNTKATFLVDSVAEYRDFLVKHGAAIIRDIQSVPTGFNLTVRHPDGTIIEYVEHNKG